MPSNDNIIFEYPSVYDEYKDEDWYLWLGSDDCPYDEKIDEEDYVPIRKIPKNPFMFVQVCAVAGKQAARIRSPLDRSGFWICDPRLIGARSDRWDFRLEFSTRSYGFPKLLQFVFDSEKHGPLNREMKIWASDSEEGWLLPSDADLWRCLQTLELKSSSESRVEEAFFNQVGALPQTGLLLLANAKKNAIYVVHLEYGPNPEATRMDYIAEFTVIMPILSFVGQRDILSHGDQIVQVYCVQTQAIQQYALDMSQCLPPPFDIVAYERQDSNNKVCIGCYCVVTTSNSKSDIFGVPFDRGRFDNTKTGGRVCSKKGRMMRKHLD